MRKSVCVFCASSENVPEVYRLAAVRTGELCAEQDIQLVNGAGALGLMGLSSNACLNAGGKVTGVIPQFMVDRGWCHHGLTELVITPDMATRRQRMRDLSEGIICLAGGCGTLEELFETVTQHQMGFYPHPIVLLNTGGYYDALIAWWRRAQEEHFMRSDHADLWHVAGTPEEAFRLFQTLPERKDTNEELSRR